MVESRIQSLTSVCIRRGRYFSQDGDQADAGGKPEMALAGRFDEGGPQPSVEPRCGYCVFRSRDRLETEPIFEAPPFADGENDGQDGDLDVITIEQFKSRGDDLQQ